MIFLHNMKKNSIAVKCAYLGLMIALALIFGYVESMIPINLGVPGVKLGLANIITVLCMYLWDVRYAAAVSFIRVILSGLLFGNLFGVLYGLSGAVLSLAVMFLLKRFFSMVTVSAMGGVFHNVGQLIMAAVVLSDLNIFYYMPVLLISGLVTGVVIGILCVAIYKRIMITSDNS